MMDLQKNIPFWAMPAVLMLLCTLFLAALPRCIQFPEHPGYLALVEVTPRSNAQPDNGRFIPADGISLTKE